MEVNKKNTNKNLFSNNLIRIFVPSVILLLSVLSYYFYNNFNKMVSESIMRSFNSNVISDVYDLSFEQLNINIITGDLKIRNVIIRPKETPLTRYPYINSSFVLKTSRIHLNKVNLYDLLKVNRLKVSKIEIEKPEISILLHGRNPIIFPFKETGKNLEADNNKFKNYLESYFLREFVLTDALLTMEDEDAGMSYKIGALNISVSDLFLNQQTGVDSLSFRKADLMLNDFITNSKTGSIRSAKSKNYELSIDSLKIQQRPDTIDYQVANFKSQITDWEIFTSDSIYKIGANSVELSYKDKAIHVNELIMKPAISREAFNQQNKFQKEQYSITVKKMDLLNISFDRLKFNQKLFIAQVNLQNADVVIYKDKTKAQDLKRFPEFPGQQLSEIGIPLTINDLNISESTLAYEEKKTDGDLAAVKIGRLNLKAKNISNQTPDSLLSVKLNGFLENKVPFDMMLVFSYKIPGFSFKGAFKSFELTNLNPVIQAFAPTSVKKGIVDAITFSGNGNQKKATGNMEFLYHDLGLTIDLQKFSKFKNSLITFAAKSFLNSSNPISPEKPARVVAFTVERDVNKGFINLIVKSVVSGLKETIHPSKENRKLNHDSNRAVRKEQRKQEKLISK
ncbi:MAG: DUF748 domain-containing protein [Bacteroidia bacterium]|nr:DUF748 domain-containing protein [Bacteroidia bacterium]